MQHDKPYCKNTHFNLSLELKIRHTFLEKKKPVSDFIKINPHSPSVEEVQLVFGGGQSFDFNELSIKGGGCYGDCFMLAGRLGFLFHHQTPANISTAFQL